MRRRRSPEIIAGRVNLDGSIAAGDRFTVQKSGTAGTYNITFEPGFRLLSCVANTYTSALGAWGGGVTPGERTCTVGTYTPSSGAGTDAPFMFIAVGVQQ